MLAEKAPKRVDDILRVYFRRTKKKKKNHRLSIFFFSPEVRRFGKKSCPLRGLFGLSEGKCSHIQAHTLAFGALDVSGEETGMGVRQNS